MRIPDDLRALHEHLRGAGGTPYIVGGGVRDHLMGAHPKDFDTEVFGLEKDALEGVLSHFGTVNFVGRSFGVYKVGNHDVSLPRRDQKVGEGHRGFVTLYDPYMGTAEASARRDYTINAIMYDTATDHVIDHHGGCRDIEARILRPVSEHFGEDPLRVLRGMQFAARFRMTAAPSMSDVGPKLLWEYSTIARERVWGEWKKFLESPAPSYGLRFLLESGWLCRYEAIQNLINVPQDPIHHPEGDVFAHTLQVVDRAAEIAERDGLTGDARITLVLAALCHDVGKAETTLCEGDRVRSPAHEKVGVDIADHFMAWDLSVPHAIRESVLKLVADHMFGCGTDELSSRSVRRLKLRLAPVAVSDLVRLMEADYSGRYPQPPGKSPQAIALAEIDDALPCTIKPILMGRHLIDMGYSPGPEIGAILKDAFQAQLEEKFSDLEGAIDWYEGYIGLQAAASR